MNRGKIVAIITGAISIILALAYLLLVQLLDFRGEMKPAPISQLSYHSSLVAYGYQIQEQAVVEH
ncbi:MAG: glucose-inhibited division protein A [Iphinoe sp. HA4291-MV1]|jgi:hypothetical protein|nr:glucose-inhibited division protein A [Iphinoe sp. HA4291-MV1]